MQADARRTAGSRLSGGQGPQHSSSELQGGRREVTGALGDVGRVEMVPTTRRLIALLLPLPLPLPMHVGTGDAVSLFFSCQPRFRCRGKAGLRCRARECRRYFEDEGEQGDDLGRFPHTSALLRSGAAVPAWWWWWWTDRHWRVDLEVSSSSRVPSTTWPMLPPPPPPEDECVTACYWLDFFGAWLGWHVIGRREGWVEELALHPTLQSSPDSKQTSTWPRRMHQQQDGPCTTDRVPWAAVLLRLRPKYLEHSRVPPSRWTLRALVPVSIGGEDGQARRPLPPTMSRHPLRTHLSPCPC